MSSHRALKSPTQSRYHTAADTVAPLDTCCSELRDVLEGKGTHCGCSLVFILCSENRAGCRWGILMGKSNSTFTWMCGINFFFFFFNFGKWSFVFMSVLAKIMKKFTKYYIFWSENVSLVFINPPLLCWYGNFSPKSTLEKTETCKDQSFSPEQFSWSIRIPVGDV